MPTEPPNVRYFLGVAGSWTCALDLHRRPDGAPWTALDRLALRVLAGWPRWLGRPWFRIEVDPRRAPQGQVRHTIRIGWAPIVILRSDLLVLLGADGRSFEVEGTYAYGLLGLARRRLAGTGEIDATATCGTYRIPWMGTVLRQTSMHEDENIVLTQETAWWWGVQRLVRRG